MKQETKVCECCNHEKESGLIGKGPYTWARLEKVTFPRRGRPVCTDCGLPIPANHAETVTAN